ncbi:hypothetical protein CVS40_1825 [Lucilia cuprina]|nr:hypothetical protein CVS40_1825 [Lucilia cuprina]
MIEEKDMIEVNLNSKLMYLQDEINDLRLREASHCITKSYSINDLKERELAECKLDNHQKYATIGGIKKTSKKMLDNPNISCLRQMYCPDCHQRLDAESVRFETLLSCCLPLFPISRVYQCCLKRSIGRKVICNKCGSNLGYWKRS